MRVKRPHPPHLRPPQFRKRKKKKEKKPPKSIGNERSRSLKTSILHFRLPLHASISCPSRPTMHSQRTVGRKKWINNFCLPGRKLTRYQPCVIMPCCPFLGYCRKDRRDCFDDKKGLNREENAKRKETWKFAKSCRTKNLSQIAMPKPTIGPLPIDESVEVKYCPNKSQSCAGY